MGYAPALIGQLVALKGLQAEVKTKWFIVKAVNVLTPEEDFVLCF